jgi:membrane peptidoglycan carboxypeptidase
MKILLIAIIIGLTLGCAFFAWDISRIVSKNPDHEFGRIILRDRNGVILTDRGMPGGYSESLSGGLDTPLVRSIIAIEDARFYNHHGTNIEAKIASLYQNIRANGVIRGGSTITEQYIKNAYFASAPRTIPQKIREMI